IMIKGKKVSRTLGMRCNIVATPKPTVVPIRKPETDNVTVDPRWGKKVGMTFLASITISEGDGSNHSSMENKRVATSHSPINNNMARNGLHTFFSKLVFIGISPLTHPL